MSIIETGKKVAEYGSKNSGPIATLGGVLVVLGAVSMLFAQLKERTGEWYYTKEHIDKNFMDTGDLAYVNERIGKHEARQSIHLTPDELADKFPPRREIDIIDANNRRQFEEIKSLLMRIEGNRVREYEEIKLLLMEGGR